MKNINYNQYIKHIDQWDKKIILNLNKINSKSTTLFLKIISFFGRETIWLLLMAIFLLLWYDPLMFTYIGATFFNGIWLNVLIKYIINRDRPFESLENLKLLDLKPSSRSFPSWHVYNGASQAIILGFLSNSILIFIFLLVLAVFIGFARILLGAHYPSDVIAGFFLGIIGALMTIFLFGPIFFSFLRYLEQFSLYAINYRTINPMLGNILYFIACMALFGLIISPTIYKYIKKDENNKRV